MGVEGKDRAKVLEAGAASLSNQLGQAVLKLRKGYGLSLADLSQHSGVAKSIISQIERNETNPTLTTIWRLAPRSTCRSNRCGGAPTRGRSSSIWAEGPRRSSSPTTGYAVSP